MARLSSSAPTEFTARSSRNRSGLFRRLGAHVLGIVLNKIDRREAGSYSYESGYSAVHQEARSAPTFRARRRELGTADRLGASSRSAREGRHASPLRHGTTAPTEVRCSARPSCPGSAVVG